MKHLRGATVIVTGASRGIGVHIARVLAREGMNLSLAARSADELDEVRTEMEALGVRAVATVCDVTVAGDRARLLERTEAELGPVDVLINNAGIEVVAHFETSNEDDLVRTLEVNLTAALLLTRAVVPGMLERGRGHVVNIASGAGKVGVPFGVAYSTSKHGMVGMTHALRAEYHGRPVGFSVVCPGFVTDVGMYARWSVRAPRIAGSARPEKVATVVRRCIVANKAEVIVNTPPLRPLVLLHNAAPRVTPAVLKVFGYSGVFQEVADDSVRR